MFRVKICGVTTVTDALTAAEAGADAIGLNCYAKSRRYCSLEIAQPIAEALPRHVRKVGVFVNATAEEIRAIADALQLDAVQLHGDEPPEFLRELRRVAVIRAFRLGEDFSSVAEYLRRCHQLNCVPRMVLVDAHSATEYGGTGATIDWKLLKKHRRDFAGVPLVLAGGLTPRNVAAAIEAVRPWAVDTASGVEDAPGKKSAETVRAFVSAAKDAFADLR